MTVAEAERLEDRVSLEELVMFLSAPEPCDLLAITDPIATFGTRPPEPTGIGFGHDLPRP